MIPSRSYTGTCAEGYRDFGFDVNTLLEAYSFSREKARAEE